MMERITLEALETVIIELVRRGYLRIKDIMDITDLSEEGAIFLARILENLNYNRIFYDPEYKAVHLWSEY